MSNKIREDYDSKFGGVIWSKSTLKWTKYCRHSFFKKSAGVTLACFHLCGPIPCESDALIIWVSGLEMTPAASSKCGDMPSSPLALLLVFYSCRSAFNVNDSFTILNCVIHNISKPSFVTMKIQRLFEADDSWCKERVKSICNLFVVSTKLSVLEYS